MESKMRYLYDTSLYRLLFLSFSLTLLACGGSDSGGGADSGEGADASSAEARADLCAVLTGDDIEQALGIAAGSPEPGDAGLGYCEWASADGDGTLVVLSLERAVLDSFDDFVAQFGEEFGGEDPPQEEYHPVAGVGDWAMYVQDEDMVRVFRGEHVLEVSAPSAEEETVVDLAKRAFPRLP